MRTRNIVALLLGIALGLLFVPLLHAQTVVVPVTAKYGALTPHLRDSLRSLWSDSVGTNERAFCVTHYTTLAVPSGKEAFAGKQKPADDTLYMIHAVEDPSVVISSTPATLVYRCRTGGPAIHSHPPVLCGPNSVCNPPGPIYSCSPSRQDYETLFVFSLPFGVVRCGPDQYVFFFPSQVRPVKAKLKPPPKS